MLPLPMKALSITDTSSSIEIIIEEVFGFPDKTDCDEGYKLKGNLIYKAGCFSATTYIYFMTYELYIFYKQLEKCYNKLRGTAVFTDTNEQFVLQFEFDKRGHVKLSGVWGDGSQENPVLQFEFTTDQTYLREPLASIKAILEVLGKGEVMPRRKKIQRNRKSRAQRAKKSS